MDEETPINDENRPVNLPSDEVNASEVPEVPAAGSKEAAAVTSLEEGAPSVEDHASAPSNEDEAKDSIAPEPADEAKPDDPLPPESSPVQPEEQSVDSGLASDECLPGETEAVEVAEPEPVKKDPARPRLHIGSAYYPEQWPAERWQEDIRLMKDLGLTVARMGEFAWSSLQPSAGEFQLDWLGQVIDLLAEADIATVLGTPSASPPAWLCHAHPELMAVEENGQRVQFGNRAHYCVNSHDFHSATRNIVEKMAEKFGPHPAVIGWQIDNEFSRVCWCDVCLNQFHQFLKNEYGTLDELNHRWATAYWSQTYSDWDQIPLPRGPHNPALRLAHKRFVTDSYVKFQKMQIDAIRPHIASSVWITHNTMNWFGGFDHYKLHADLDMASWDWYIGTGHNDPLETGAAHDLVRGYKKRNFWVMETQPGHVNWAGVNNDLHKGEGRTMAWEAVSHGADGFLYWQWRSAPNGQEQMHGTLLDQSGEFAPFAEEVRRIAKEFSQVSDLLIPSEVRAKIAILNDYDSRWLLEWQPHHEDFSYVEHLLRHYSPMAGENVSIDIVSADDPLDGYRLVIVPSIVIIDETRRQNLQNVLNRNGYILITQRTGMRDRDNRSLEQRPPGPLTEMAGVEVRQGFALDEPVHVKGNWFEGDAFLYSELLNITDSSITIPAARYGNDHSWLADTPAITVHGFRGGLVYYSGTILDDDAQQLFMARIVRNAGQKPTLDVPRGVKVGRRMRPDGQEILILVNHTRDQQRINLKDVYRERIRDLDLRDEFFLAPYGIAILTRIQPDANPAAS